MIRSIRKPQRVLVLVLSFFVIFVAGCTFPLAATTTRSSSGSTPARIRILLEHRPTGTADLLWSSSKHALMVTISVTGLAPGSTHLVHIHAGTCSAMGQIVYALQPVIADARGIGSSAMTIANVRSIPLNGWTINIHNGSTLATSLEARPISCGNIFSVRTVTRGVQSAQVQLSSTMYPDENVHGIAQVRMMGSAVIVTLSLSGMAPNTTHMAHIHAGRCAAQGPVLFALQPVVADAQGNAMTVTTITGHTLPPAHWYINVHEAGTMAAMMTPQGFTPIACGDGQPLDK